MESEASYNKNLIKTKDMCLGFYTLEFRKFGQGTKCRAQTWRERTKLTKNNQKQVFLIERVSAQTEEKQAFFFESVSD